MRSGKRVEILAPDYMITRIGRDSFMHGELVFYEGSLATCVPKYIFYKDKKLNENTKRIGSIITNCDIDCFGFSELGDIDEQIKECIERVEIITDFNQKVEAVKSKYNLTRQRRELEKKEYAEQDKARRDDWNFGAVVLSIFIGLGIMSITEIPASNIMLFGIILFFLMEYTLIGKIEKRYTVTFDEIDRIIATQEYEDKITVNYANLLMVFWKNRNPSVHTLVNKSGYNKWVENMKKLNSKK